jgi:two-component system, NarL family, nitrate/nitrite response regulator NarL
MVASAHSPQVGQTNRRFASVRRISSLNHARRALPLRRAYGSRTVAGPFDQRPRDIRILIADGQPIFRQGVVTVLVTQPDLCVVGSTSDGAEAIKLTRERAPDVLLLDLAIPGLAGVEVLRKVRCSAPQVRTIILAAEIDTPETLEALNLGARGFVPKDCSAELLFKAIRSVMAGQYWMGREKIAGLLQSFSNNASAASRPLESGFRLTPRELQIISALIEGESNKGIGKKFGLSEDTVKHHLTHIFDKLGVGTRLELAVLAIEQDLLRRWSAEYTPARFREFTIPLKSEKSG